MSLGQCFDYFCRYLRGRDVLALASTCRTLHEHVGLLTRAYCRNWHRRRRAMEACLANDVLLVRRFTRGTVDASFLQALIQNRSVAKEVYGNVQSGNLYALYAGVAQGTPPYHFGVLTFCCIHNLHAILKTFIRQLHRERVDVAIRLQDIAFWNASWDCYRLLQVLVSPRDREAQNAYPLTACANVVMVRTSAALARLRQKAKKYDINYRDEEWCLMAIRCNDASMYLKYAPTLALRGSYCLPHFVMCDDVSIVSHWYTHHVPVAARGDFITYMKQHKANKRVIRALLSQTDNTDGPMPFLLLFGTVLLLVMFLVTLTWGMFYYPSR